MRSHASVHKGFRGCSDAPSASRGDVVRILPRGFAGRSRIRVNELVFAGTSHLG